MEKDIKFQKILLSREIPEPSDDLEDRIMDSISKIATQNPANNKSLFLAWFFFLVGLATGVIISTIWISSDRIIFGYNLSDHGVIIQILCSIVILLLFERLFNLTFELRNKHFKIKTKSNQV
jgi:cytochrome c biogenesis protein CcdA